MVSFSISGQKKRHVSLYLKSLDRTANRDGRNISTSMMRAERDELNMLDVEANLFLGQRCTESLLDRICQAGNLKEKEEKGLGKR